MVRLWRRKHMVRPLPHLSDADRERHAESIRAAQRAIKDNERTTSVVSRLGDQVGEIADTLGGKGRRNHFSEQIAAMLHGHPGNGPGSAAPRRG